MENMLTGMAANKAQNFLRGGGEGRGGGGGECVIDFDALQIRYKYWLSLCEMCPDTEFCEVRIFSAFSPNAGKYEPQKTPHLDPFHAVSQGDIFMANVFPSVK